MLNLVQAGYQILYIIATVDHQIDTVEKETIKNFLKENFSGDFDIQSETNILAMLDESSKNLIFQDAIRYYEKNATLEERKKIFYFAYHLLNKDRVIQEEEKRLLQELIEYWQLKEEK